MIQHGFIIGDPGEARNVSYIWVKNHESKSVQLTWKTPLELANNLLDHISYHLQYCHEQKCQNKTGITNNNGNKVTLDGLTPGSRYTYTLTTIREDDHPGNSKRGFFETNTGMFSAHHHTKFGWG